MNKCEFINLFVRPLSKKAPLQHVMYRLKDDISNTLKFKSYMIDRWLATLFIGDQLSLFGRSLILPTSADHRETEEDS